MNKNNLNNADKNIVFVLASVLKPVKDVRMYEKIGKSLIKKYENATFHFVGQANSNDTENIQNPKNTHFHELFNFNRIALKRFFTFFTFFSFLLKIKPKILVVGTFELLLPAVFYKIFSIIFLRKKVKLVYDIQENYVANIRYTKVFLPVLRDLIAIYVYFIQKTTSFFVNFFFLAEYCYEQELTFIGKNKKKYEILPNFILREKEIKLLHEGRGKPSPYNFNTKYNLCNLLLLGTISNDYGLQKTLTYFDYITKKQQEKQPKTNIKLTILGHCPLEKDFLSIKKLSKINPLIEAQISQKPIPYTQIKEKMKAASQKNTFVVMPYIINQSYEKRIPTKFYECLAYNLPMIIQHNWHWINFFREMQKLIPTHRINVFFINFDDNKTFFEHKILTQNLNQNNQNSHLIQNLPIFWDICEDKLNKIAF